MTGLRRAIGPLLGGGVLVAFLVGGVFPTRTYLQQRDAIAAQEAKVAVLSEENAKLTAKVDRLHTDAEIERLAREQYNLVRPGEEAYAILPGPADPAPEPAAELPAPVTLDVAERSWWDRTTDVLTFWD